jgi:hypothetical protein
MPAVWNDFQRWSSVDEVRNALDGGADPNAMLTSLGSRPLHMALGCLDASLEVVQLLIERGADVDAVDHRGVTPLWYAVRWGYEEAAAALLAAGADPWRPVVAGRSAGRVALDGPLADLFANLPGVPSVSDEERRRQAEADDLVASYADLKFVANFYCLGFVRGLSEDEIIRRAGADPVNCPPGDLDQYLVLTQPLESSALWVGTPASGGVVIVDLAAGLPVSEDFCRGMSAGDVILASTFDNPAGGDQWVQWWRAGTLLARPSAFDDPRGSDPDEAWLCRFGDKSHGSYSHDRSLALMSMLTGVHADARWLLEVPKRLVHLPGRR